MTTPAGLGAAVAVAVRPEEREGKRGVEGEELPRVLPSPPPSPSLRIAAVVPASVEEARCLPASSDLCHRTRPCRRHWSHERRREKRRERECCGVAVVVEWLGSPSSRLGGCCAAVRCCLVATEASRCRSDRR
ncbi:uncharacterized protein DS421_19g641850 [Arachis hypogaea]|uniref:Uncharacterized protein n=1 Tax=Arachis hypogaea TaxID=3818 RepID=A0A6B9V447_ARAHY|nr:uncharacterized protein DS421_19g641850 [Arachis hypogaea]